MVSKNSYTHPVKEYSVSSKHKKYSNYTFYVFFSFHCNHGTVSKCEPLPLARVVPRCTISSHRICGSVIFLGTAITVTYEETVQEMLMFDWIAVVSAAQEPVEDTISCILLYNRTICSVKMHVIYIEIFVSVLNRLV